MDVKEGWFGGEPSGGKTGLPEVDRFLQRASWIGVGREARRGVGPDGEFVLSAGPTSELDLTQLEEGRISRAMMTGEERRVPLALTDDFLKRLLPADDFEYYFDPDYEQGTLRIWRIENDYTMIELVASSLEELVGLLGTDPEGSAAIVREEGDTVTVDFSGAKPVYLDLLSFEPAMGDSTGVGLTLVFPKPAPPPVRTLPPSPPKPETFEEPGQPTGLGALLRRWLG